MEQAMTRYLARSVLLGCLLASSTAFAQSFPTRPVTIVAATAPGAVSDVLLRAVSQRLSEKWNQPVLIENRPGGRYAIAAAAVLKAERDGHTLIAPEIGMFTIEPHLSTREGKAFDPTTDFVPVAAMAGIPVALIVNPSVPAKSVSELVALAKARPGAITYGTAGPATAIHLSTLLLESLAGIKLAPVHYRGAAPALNDVMAGHINMITMGPSIALPSYREGKLRILGIGSSEPIPQLPHVPPIAATLPGYESSVTFGLAAPAGTPREVVARINADVQQILRDPAFQAKFLEPHLLQVRFGSPDEFAAFLESESRKWGKVIRAANLKLD
jgi:tripartite-type tricarboxylate transporter receptor subunit TctC